MFKILGTDGKEYGPVNLEQLSDWVRQGRVNAQTQVQPTGSMDWKPAGQIPELQSLFTQMRGAPPQAPAPPAVAAAPPAGAQSSGLAITSLVLGITSVLCLGPLTGIPAIICGHLAHNRTKRSPAQFGGSGMAIAGFIMGYASLVIGLFLAAMYSAMLIPALSRAKGRAQEINCINNMKQIGLSFKTWAIDHNDQFPFNVSTNAGGTLELSAPGADGYSTNATLNFVVLSNELSTPRILVCPADTKQAALDWQSLTASNVTYLVRSGPEVTDTNPQQILAICPIHHHVLRADGSVSKR